MFWCNIVIGHYHDENGDDVGGGPGTEIEGFCKWLKTAIFFLVVIRKIMSIKWLIINGKAMETDLNISLPQI